MSKPVPQISKFMTQAPHTIGVDQTLANAQKMMKDHRIRHLPVLRAGHLVGMITERDLALIETLRDVDPTRVTVEDAMSQDPYTVAPDMGLDLVAATMAEQKYGSAVVVDNGHVVGVFTTVDAMTALAELLQTRLARA